MQDIKNLELQIKKEKGIMQDIKNLELRLKKETGVVQQEFWELGYKDGTQDADKMSKSYINKFQRVKNKYKQIDSFRRFGSRQSIEKMERLFGSGLYDIEDRPKLSLKHEGYIYVYCVAWAHGVRQYLKSSQK